MSKSIFTKEHQYLIEQLKKARIEIGLDQITVGKLLKRSQSIVSKIESGQMRIDVIQLMEFARIYKKELGFFVKKK